MAFSVLGGGMLVRDETKRQVDVYSYIERSCRSLSVTKHYGSLPLDFHPLQK